MSVKPIGQGGMGTIFLGQEKKTEKRVAVKKLSLAKNTDMKALHNEIAMMQVFCPLTTCPMLLAAC
jgi:serine/threonine protein kinase